MSDPNAGAGSGDDHEYTLDDELEYAGWRLGRPLRTAEVDAPDGTHTIEEGVLTCELVTKDQLREAKRDGGWTAHYVAPDGGVGLGLGDDGNSGGVSVPYTLESTITFPTPMTEREADEWLPDGWFHEYPDVDLPGLEWFDDGDTDSDTETDTGSGTGVLVESDDGEMVIESDTTAADLLEDCR
jgi:hypothetical protein